MARRVISAQIKARVFADLKAGLSAPKAAAKHKVHVQTVYKWILAATPPREFFVATGPRDTGADLNARIASTEQALADLYAQRIKAKVLATFTAAIASGTL